MVHAFFIFFYFRMIVVLYRYSKHENPAIVSNQICNTKNLKEKRKKKLKDKSEQSTQPLKWKLWFQKQLKFIYVLNLRST